MATAIIIIASLLVAVVGGALCGAWVESEDPTPDIVLRAKPRREGRR